MRSTHRFALGYLIVTAALIVATGVVMGEVRLDPQDSYRADFADASGLRTGDPVRAAGVTVGSVQEIDLQPDNTVRVAFTIAADMELTESTHAIIRYRTMTGSRYLELQQGREDGTALERGGILPMSQTSPGLDLDSVFNGFKPVIRGLAPEEMNAVSQALVEIFQDDGENTQRLLGNIAILVTALAERDDVISDLIVNFEQVLSTLGRRDRELRATVTNLHGLLEGLASDRTEIADALDGTARLTRESALFIQAIRPSAELSVRAAGNVAAAINSNLELLDHYLTIMPSSFAAATRVSANGAFYNMYVCGVSLLLDAPGGGTLKTPMTVDKSERCQFPEEE